MYRAVLVDDEQWILESLKATLDWKEHGFEIVGEAMNGIDGLERIRDIRPDVAFIDIRMPGLNGIELIGKLKDDDLPTKYIVASGYAEFEYAKQAMEYGAVGYCLKPFRKDEIVEVLTSVKEQIQKESQALHNELMVLLQDTKPVSREMMEVLLRRMRFEWNESDGAFVVVVQGKGEPRFPCEWQGVSLRIGSGKTAYLLHGSQRGETFARLTGALPQGAAAAGISEVFRDCGRIREHIDAANTASYRFFVTGASSIGMTGPQRDVHLDAAAVKRLHDGFKRKDMVAVRQGLNMLKPLFLSGHYDIGHARRLYNLVLTYVYPEIGNQGEAFVTDDDELSARYGDVSDMIASLRQLASESFADPGTDTEDIRNEETFQIILQYIRSHFHERISIQDIAKKFYMHPNYLSTLFKKERHINFTKYVTDLRMQYACELLQTTILTVGDIAEQAGYKDYFYFAKLFKKHTGKTPTAYRTNES